MPQICTKYAGKKQDISKILSKCAQNMFEIGFLYVLRKCKVRGRSVKQKFGMFGAGSQFQKHHGTGWKPHGKCW